MVGTATATTASATSTCYQYPASNHTVNSFFGQRGDSQYRATDGHTGTDYNVRWDQVYSVADGRVVLVSTSETYGNYIVIQHPDGMFSTYAHLSQIKVPAGVSVARGQNIAISGNTGASDGPHLHLNIAYSLYGAKGYPAPQSTRTDPDAWIKSHGCGPVTSPPNASSRPNYDPTGCLNTPDSALQARVQQALKNRGRYSGQVDGKWGIYSVQGIQTTVRNVGYTGAIDGIAGAETCRYVQIYAKKFGSYTGTMDGVPGPNTWKGFALGLERP